MFFSIRKNSIPRPSNIQFEKSAFYGRHGLFQHSLLSTDTIAFAATQANMVDDRTFLL